MRKFFGLTLTTLVLAAAIACGGGDDGDETSTEADSIAGSATATTDQPSTEATATTSPEPTPEPTPAPSEVAELIFFGADPPEESPFARFAATITNPTNSARDRIEVSWTMYAADDAVVGFHSSTICPIPAGGSALYVGGAGALNLSGSPASVEVEVSDFGREIDSYTNPFTVENIEIEEESDFDVGFREVAFAVTNTADIAFRSDGVVASIILKDAQGQVVGADFHRLENVPDEFPAGGRFAQAAQVSSTIWTGEPVSAEVQVCHADQG